MSGAHYTYHDSIMDGHSSMFSGGIYRDNRQTNDQMFGGNVDEEVFDEEIEDDVDDNIEGGGPKTEKFKAGWKKFWEKVKSGGKKVWENLPVILKTTEEILKKVKEGAENLPDGKTKEVLNTISKYGEKGLEVTKEGQKFLENVIPKGSGGRIKDKHIKQIEDVANRLVKSEVKRAKVKKFLKQKKAIKASMKDQKKSKHKQKKKDAKR